MIGDAEILQPQFASGFGHFFKCIVTVARQRVAMKCATKILLLDELWQRMLFSGFELATVFPQLRRNEIEIDRAIQIGFVAYARNFAWRFFLLRVRINWDRGEAVFIER